MPSIWNRALSQTTLILLALLFLGEPMAQAQDSLEDLQKRKAIAEAEKAAIEAEIARDEARNKQFEWGGQPESVKVASDGAMESSHSANAIAGAQKSQPPTHSLCVQCLKAAQNELKMCLDAAISQEDKKSCLQKQETRAKTCDDGECKLERAQLGNKGDLPSAKK